MDINFEKIKSPLHLLFIKAGEMNVGLNGSDSIRQEVLHCRIQGQLNVTMMFQSQITEKLLPSVPYRRDYCFCEALGAFYH